MHSVCQSSPYWSLSKKALDFILGQLPHIERFTGERDIRVFQLAQLQYVIDERQHIVGRDLSPSPVPGGKFQIIGVRLSWGIRARNEVFAALARRACVSAVSIISAARFCSSISITRPYPAMGVPSGRRKTEAAACCQRIVPSFYRARYVTSYKVLPV